MTKQQPLQFYFNPEYTVRIDSALSQSLNLYNTRYSRMDCTAFKKSTDSAIDELKTGINVMSKVVTWKFKIGKIKLPMRNTAWNSDLNLVRKFALSNSLKSGVQDRKVERLGWYKLWRKQGNTQKALCQNAEGEILYMLRSRSKRRVFLRIPTIASETKASKKPEIQWPARD